MTRSALIAIEIIVGVGALFGGVYGIAGAPKIPREWLRGSPFRSYVVPGAVLLVIVGGSALVAAGLLLAEASAARLMSLEAGVILAGWIAAQISLIGYRSWLQPLFFAVGIAVVVLSFSLPAPG